MAIPPRFLSELRDRLTLSDIIGRRVKLQRGGMREFKGCCPFHQEKSPSFTVSDEKQFYHCFGCGAHGDVIGFMMQHSNLSFIEAVEMLAAEAGMQVPDQSPEEIETAKKQKDLYALLEDACKWFERQLREPKNREALAYMHERGVTDELMAAFRIGFAPADGQALWKFLKEQGYTDKQMEEAAVVRPSTRGGSPYSFFRERVIFPVADRRGRVVAFGGRILPEHLRTQDKGDGKPPKYINSSDSPLFHKGRMLYGESHARQAAADGQPLIVVEGYVDVMSCFSAGYRGAVAPLGTALTEEQIVVLWKMIPGQQKNPVLCFDGDNAGRRAAVRACERLMPLLAPDQSALIAFLPEGQDPDSLIRGQGGASFEKVIAGAMPLADFLWQHHTGGRRFDTPETKAGLAKVLEEEVLRIADRGVQQYYRQAFRDRLYNTFSPQKSSAKSFKNKGKIPTAPLVKPGLSVNLLSSQIMLAALINHPVIFEQVEEELGQMPMANERLDLLRQTILNILNTAQTLDSEGVQTHLKEQGFESELKSVLSPAVYTHAGFLRPGTGIDAVMEGWRETRKVIEREALWKDLMAAKKALAENFSKENEERLMAIYALLNVHKASEG